MLKSLKHLTHNVPKDKLHQILYDSTSFHRYPKDIFESDIGASFKRYVTKDKIDWTHIKSDINTIKELNDSNKMDTIIIVDLLKDLEEELILSKMNTIFICKHGHTFLTIDNGHRDRYSAYIRIRDFANRLD